MYQGNDDIEKSSLRKKNYYWYFSDILTAHKEMTEAL